MQYDDRDLEDRFRAALTTAIADQIVLHRVKKILTTEALVDTCPRFCEWVNDAIDGGSVPLLTLSGWRDDDVANGLSLITGLVTQDWGCEILRQLWASALMLFVRSVSDRLAA